MSDTQTSNKTFYLLKCRMCGQAPSVLAKFRAKFNNYKSAQRS